ncbi:tetratricopeptide repeat protein [Psychrobacillus sp. L4]|uniref:tetratricopeptide repeat protein n=1 Tax=Psychrobacillus sp. L4 TaxID=3236892 RepID=UPI0036F1ED29
MENRPYLSALFAYGVWEFELGQYQTANTYFRKLLELNPNDNQGVRYLEISTLMLFENGKMLRGC